MTSPKDVYNSTTEQIQGILDKILLVEKQYEHMQNIEKNKILPYSISNQLMNEIG